MSRFYVPPESVTGKTIKVVGDEAHHIRDVMRLKKGDRLTAFDGTGKEYPSRIRDIDSRSVILEISEVSVAPHRVKNRFALIQAIPKKEKMDYIIEKAVELGAERITPVLTERTVVNWEDKKRLAIVERWRRISREASKQCGRADIAEIDEIRDYAEVITKINGYTNRLIAALDNRSSPLKEVLKGVKGGSIVAAIGPEGDFTPDEVNAARENGFKLVDLGKTVLKSDTAGLAVLAILNYEFPD